MDAVKLPCMIAVSGVKNSGKTTFLENVVRILREKGYLAAVIKHDGHDFASDVEGTDTWRMEQAGAYGTAIFSAGKWMAVKHQQNMDEKLIAEMYPEADVILLEGFKYSDYPKFEIIRKGISTKSICKKETLLALITDTDLRIQGIPGLGMSDYQEAVKLIEEQIRKKKLNR